MKRVITGNEKTIDFRERNRQLQASIDYKAVGRHMQAVRQKRGMTQAVVAEHMKVSIKYYSAIECGTVRINLYRLIQFVCLMHVSADALLVGCHHDYPSHYLSPEDSNEDLKQLISMLEQCSSDNIKMVRTLAEALIQSSK